MNTNIQPDENKTVAIELNIIHKAVERVKKELLKSDPMKKKSWMTNGILSLMEERRRQKRNPTEYSRIHHIIRQEIKKAKENELREKCQEIE